MSLSLKQINNLFYDIRDGKSALLLGQEYFKVDPYYSSVLKQLDIKNETPSLNSLWEKAPDTLGKAMVSAAEHASYQPWLRAILSLRWNIILSSSPNNLWFKNSIGNNFSLNIQTQEELTGNLDFYKYFNKQQPHFISLFGDENSIPENRKNLLKLKNKTGFIDMIFNQILFVWGYLVIDGLTEDDWFDIGRLLSNFDKVPNGCIYIFGMDKQKAEQICKSKNEDDWMLLEEYIDNGQIVLCEMSLKDAVTEVGLADEDEEDEEENYENEVRISLPNNDTIWIPRKECSRLNSIGITLMRDEIFTPYLLDDKNKDRAFADFIQQRDKKSWNYFNIIYNKEKMSFHVPRDVEDYLKNTVSEQLKSKNKMREIILLKGNSNSGKTTSLSWFAWYAASARGGIAKGKNNKYIVLFISGDPTNRESDWQDSLIEFIKNYVYAQRTTKGDRIRNVIIIWDNYSSTKKKTDYIDLYNKLNECNAVLIGSIYLFESVNVDSSVVQGVAFNELKPLHTTLEQKAKIALDALLDKINKNWRSQSGSVNSSNDYLFEKLINFAKYQYSPEWEKVRNVLNAGLYKEAKASENVSNDLFKIFKDKNVQSFNDVKKTVFSLGIGSSVQSKFMDIDSERQKRNVPLINAIRQMNLILAVANQFKKSIKLPLSVLMCAISEGKQYTGDYNKLNRILRTDSMAEYDSNSSTGNITVSFRHPSEAIAYLDYNYGKDRKYKEIEVVKCLIETCRWDNYEEAQAVAAFVRSFGTNSYGKVNDQSVSRGQYREYSEFWPQIVECLNKYASSNPEAMLISGHFTRDYIETNGRDNTIDFLQDAISRMKDAAEQCHAKPTLSRLYGEICRNLLQQMKIYDDTRDEEKIKELSDEFEGYFEFAVKNGIESKQNNSFSLTLLLDIWLNYVISIQFCDDYMIPDTLEYIDLLFYNESSLIDDSDDYVNVLSNINKIYEKVNERSVAELREYFSNPNNDSYAYFLVKQILVKLLLKYKEKKPELFDRKSIDKDSNACDLSGRIFFLNENAADDFEYYHATGFKGSVKDVFRNIKKDLRTASEEIINVLKSEFPTPDDMSYRCLLMYFKAKWMSYTGNLLLETEQYPALKNEEWFEMSEICRTAISKAGDNDIIIRSLNFILNIYAFAFEGKQWDMNRYFSESPVRLICLCGPEKKGEKGIPRRFRVSVKEGNRPGKLSAEIDSEIVDNNKTKTAIVGQKKIYVPESVKNYRDIRRNNLNINQDFMIWFNLGGPQLRDFDPDPEV